MMHARTSLEVKREKEMRKGEGATKGVFHGRGGERENHGSFQVVVLQSIMTVLRPIQGWLFQSINSKINPVHLPSSVGALAFCFLTSRKKTPSPCGMGPFLSTPLTFLPCKKERCLLNFLWAIVYNFGHRGIFALGFRLKIPRRVNNNPPLQSWSNLLLLQ